MPEKDFIEATICWILKDGKALLKFAKKGVSEGRWNAVGGKVEHGETLLECVKREVLEETYLTIGEAFYHGKFKFVLGEDDSTEQWMCHIFSTGSFTGQLKESSEGELRWFDIDKIPFDKMWQDDALWVPLMLDGKRFEGEFFFSEDGTKLLKHELHIKG